MLKKLLTSRVIVIAWGGKPMMKEKQKVPSRVNPIISNGLKKNAP